MASTLVKAMIAITLALAFYTIGVYWEQRDKVLKPVHLVFFWLGFCMDSAGTGLMTSLGGGSTGFLTSLHSITGIIAIVLMLMHAIWATAVLVLKDHDAAKVFNKYSMKVWHIWLLPYVLGMLLGMIGGT